MKATIKTILAIVIGVSAFFALGEIDNDADFVFWLVMKFVAVGVIFMCVEFWKQVNQVEKGIPNSKILNRYCSNCKRCNLYRASRYTTCEKQVYIPGFRRSISGACATTALYPILNPKGASSSRRRIWMLICYATNGKADMR